MFVPKTKEDLERLIRDKAEESLQLEFKHARALDRKNEAKKDEISKDVTAMANSAGGVIIYGIAEKEHYAGEITPIKRLDYSKEWLNQIITSHIQPRIEGILIHPVSLDGDDDVAYVVEVPQSSTAHQARDRRYYRRHNFDILAMEDYEIRDVMNRVRHPIIVPKFKIVRDVRTAQRIRHQSTKYYLRVRPFNEGMVLARYVNYWVELPDGMSQEGQTEVYGENTVRDLITVKFITPENARPEYGPSRYDPILPGLGGPKKDILLGVNLEACLATLRDASIGWSCHADNAPPRTGSVLIRDIEVNDDND